MVLVLLMAVAEIVQKVVFVMMATFLVAETVSQSLSAAAATMVPTTQLEKAFMSETPAPRNVLATLEES